jgi:hypothetical protein
VGASVGLTGCSDDTSVVIDVLTDYRPGIEFQKIDVSVYREGMSAPVAEERFPVVEESGFLRGKRVTEVSLQQDGRYRVEVELLKDDGTLLGRHRRAMEVEGRTQIVAAVYRACSDIECPPLADPTHTECRMVGEDVMCVPPECNGLIEEDEALCPPAVSPPCMEDGDCSPLSECAPGMCVRGACLPEYNDALCGGENICCPSTGDCASRAVCSEGPSWYPELYIKAPTEVREGDAGWSVALNGTGTLAAVGAPGSEGARGTVHLYEDTGSGWQVQSSVVASVRGGGDRFGFSVALSSDGSTLVVGAPEEDSDSGDDPSGSAATGSGAAYIFRSDGEAWVQTAYLKASNAGTDYSFGEDVAISADGKTVVVGSPHEGSLPDSDLFAEREGNGAAYVFQESDSGWIEVAILREEPVSYDAAFGIAVSVVSGVIAVGASGESSAVGGVNPEPNPRRESDSGAVFLFDESDTGWALSTWIKASDPSVSGLFGVSLALSGDGMRLVVGANKGKGQGETQDHLPADRDVATGSVYVFSREDGVWQEEAILRAAYPGEFDYFGAAVAIDGRGFAIAVGAPREDSSSPGGTGDGRDNETEHAGAVFAFARVDGEWVQAAFLKPEFSTADDRHGSSVAINYQGMRLLAGSPGEDSDAVGLGGEMDSAGASNSGASYTYVFGLPTTAL